MIEATTVLWLMGALFIKHFLIDFPLQRPYHYLNKGTYGHWGGIEHSGMHAFGTLLILMVMFNDASPLIAPMIAFAEFLVHYHTDWAKVQINKRYGWDCKVSSEFWVLLGVDQLVHALTYVWIGWVVVHYMK